MNTPDQPIQKTDVQIEPAKQQAVAQPLTEERMQHAVGTLQLLGIHPACAVLLVTVDTMLFGVTVATAGVGYIVSIPVALVLGGIVTIFQKRSYNDDWLLAAGKGLTFALLTAIPTPLPSIITAGSGVLGGIQSVKNILNKPKPVQGTVIQNDDGQNVVYVQNTPKSNRALWFVIGLLMILVAILMVRIFI